MAHTDAVRHITKKQAIAHSLPSSTNNSLPQHQLFLLCQGPPSSDHQPPTSLSSPKLASTPQSQTQLRTALTHLRRHNNIIPIRIKHLTRPRTIQHPRRTDLTARHDIDRITHQIRARWADGEIILPTPTQAVNSPYLSKNLPEQRERQLTSLQRNTPPPSVHASRAQTRGPACT